MIRVDTARSVYIFDEAGRYLRLPRGETPRAAWETAKQVESQWLADNEWLPVTRVELFHEFGNPEGPLCLRILYPGAHYGVCTTAIREESLEAAKQIADQYT